MNSHCLTFYGTPDHPTSQGRPASSVPPGHNSTDFAFGKKWSPCLHVDSKESPRAPALKDTGGAGVSQRLMSGGVESKIPHLWVRKMSLIISLSTGEYMSTFVRGFGIKHQILKHLVTTPTHGSDLTPSYFLPSLSETWNKNVFENEPPLLSFLSPSSHHRGGSCGCVFPHVLYPPGKNYPATFPED